MPSQFVIVSLLVLFTTVPLSVSSHDHVQCRNVSAFNVCETESVLQSVVQIHNADMLNLTFSMISGITPNAFKDLRIINLKLDFGGEYEHVQNVTLAADSFLGLPLVRNLTITHAMFPFSLNPFRHLTLLKHLSILFSVTQQLPAEFLSSFPQLRSFALIAHALNDITISTLSGASQNLERLSFYKGFISTIQPRSFETLHHLNYLSLSRNPLGNLEPGTFDGLNELEELNLSWIGASMNSKTLFHGLRQLKKLDLNHNLIGNLEIGVFDGLEKLERLNLAHNRLMVLPRGVFHDLKQLKFLDMHMNKIIIIPNNIFNDLTNLKELKLGRNAISIIEVNAFAGLNLITLSLHRNRPLNVIRTDTFNELNVIDLDLSNQELIEIRENAFRGARIEKLLISENRLKQVNKSAWGLDESSLVMAKQ